MAEMKTAAYICSGCGIGERVSTAQMAKIAQKEGNMALVREHACLCDETGVQTIRDDIEKEAVIICPRSRDAPLSRQRPSESSKRQFFHSPSGRT